MQFNERAFYLFDKVVTAWVKGLIIWGVVLITTNFVYWAADENVAKSLVACIFIDIRKWIFVFINFLT